MTTVNQFVRLFILAIKRTQHDVQCTIVISLLFSRTTAAESAAAAGDDDEVALYVPGLHETGRPPQTSSLTAYHYFPTIHPGLYLGSPENIWQTYHNLMGANQQTYNMPYTYSTRTITDHDTIASG
jgi:hypothetical protein